MPSARVLVAIAAADAAVLEADALSDALRDDYQDTPTQAVRLELTVGVAITRALVRCRERLGRVVG